MAHIAENSFELWTSKTLEMTLQSPINRQPTHNLPARFEVCLCLLCSLHLICSWGFLLSIQIFSLPSDFGYQQIMSSASRQEKFLFYLLWFVCFNTVHQHRMRSDAHQLFDEQIIIILTKAKMNQRQIK